MENLLLTIPAGLFLVINILMSSLFRKPAKRLWLMLLPCFTLVMLWQLPEGHSQSFHWLNLSLSPVSLTTTGLLFASIFLLVTFAANLFAFKQNSDSELIAANLYAASAVGVCLAGDFITLFVFWEIMALASSVVIFSKKSASSGSAALRYFYMHLLGGSLLLAGISAHIASGNTIALSTLTLNEPAGILILLAFLINAGAPPFSAWLPDAYPEASYSGSVYLSAFTTKTAVFAILTVFPGQAVLIPVGLYMIVYGIIYAIRESDIRRMLSYSIISQVGFMITGIGIGTEMALNGVILHAFSHIIYKGLLMMTAGSIILQTGTTCFGQARRLCTAMPWTTAFAIAGALSISAFPFSAGYLSKSMLTASASGTDFSWLLSVASGCTFLYAGMKLVGSGFFSAKGVTTASDPSRNMSAAMFLLAILCIVPGLFSGQITALLPYATGYTPYTLSAIGYQLGILAVAAIIYLPLRRSSILFRPVTVDTDWIWRKGLLQLVRMADEAGKILYRQISSLKYALLQQFMGHSHSLFHERGKLTKSPTHGKAVLWLTTIFLVLLLLFLARFYF